MRPFFNPGKPLSTRTGRSLFPTVYVDTSETRSGPRPRPEALVPDLEFPQGAHRILKAKDPYVYNPDQAALAATQWGSAESRESGDWLKSWYFPKDAMDPWPDKTDLCCWWCSHPFTWAPFPMPYSYDPRNDRYRVTGIFCGPSCAKAFAANRQYTNIQNITSWISIIAKEYYGYVDRFGGIIHIPVAPARELLQMFCGPKGLSIKQFRSVCVHGRTLRIKPPNWVTEKQIVEAEQQNAQTYPVFHPEAPDRIERTQDLVKVRRTPYAGKGVRRIGDYLKRKSKQPPRV